MKRRKFIKAAAVGSSCVLANSVVAGSALSNEADEKYYTKVTVLKRTVNNEWSLEFKGKESKVCHRFSDGQEFIVENPWDVPEGFCAWAWGDIRTMILMVNEGRFKTFVSCCTDGFRPVFFKIERIKS